jgi:hypothetical protein
LATDKQKLSYYPDKYFDRIYTASLFRQAASEVSQEEETGTMLLKKSFFESPDPGKSKGQWKRVLAYHQYSSNEN